MKMAVVIGATGDVGRGIIGALHEHGFHTTAVGRSQERLEELRADLQIPDLRLIVGNIASSPEAQTLATSLITFSPPDLIVVSVNGKLASKPLQLLTAGDMEATINENVTPHLVSARALMPLIAEGGTYIGIGGGMADHVFPDMAAISMAQAAQRILYRHLAREPAYANINIRELRLYSMISGKTSIAHARPNWITADEVGRHLVAVVNDLQTFSGPILSLKSRKQVGFPE